MDDRSFDALTRSLAAGRWTRRRATKAVAGGVLGALTAALGLARGVEAAGCKPPGGKCKHDGDCCTKNCNRKKGKCRGCASGKTYCAAQSTCLPDDDCCDDTDCDGEVCQPDGSCAGACTPRTCAEQGSSCGLTSDACGGTMDCGTCPNGQACDAGTCRATCKASNISCTTRGECCQDPNQTAECRFNRHIFGSTICGSNTETRCCRDFFGECTSPCDCCAGLECNSGRCACPSGSERCGGACIQGGCPAGSICNGSRCCKVKGTSCTLHSECCNEICSIVGQCFT
jgi:hypothetical protein